MKYIKAIGIEGVADFKKTVLPIGPGVTYLYGYNALDNGNPNAAGKSVLASAASEIFYDTPMVGAKEDRSKVGVRRISWTENKRVHKVVSEFRGGKEKLTFSIDGTPKEARTVSATREVVRKAWKLSEDDYRTYGYLDSATPHPLVRGSTAIRKAFFTSFFQLDRLDREKKLIAKRASELKKIRAQHTELDRTFQEVKGDMLTKAERLNLEVELKAMKAKAKKLRALADEAQLAKTIADFKVWAKPHLAAFRVLVPNLSEFDAVLEKTSKRFAKARNAAEQASEYEVFRRQLKVWKAKAEGLDMTKSDSDLEAISDKYKEALAAKARLETELKSLSQAKAPEKVAKPDEDEDKATSKVYKLRHELEHLDKFDKGVCGECGQEVKTRKRSIVKAELEQATSVTKAWKAYKLYKELKASWTTTQEDVAHIEAKLTKVKKRVQDLEADAKLWEKRSKLRKPEKVEKPEDYEDPRELDEQVRVLKFFESHLDMLARLDKPLKVQPFDLDKLDRLQEKIAKAEARLEVHNTVKKRAARIRARLQELEAELVDEDAISLLLDAYGEKAAKKMAVDEISKRLMAMVNKLSGVAFKDYSFEFVWDSKIQLLVHRPKGTTDVRKLSGAESKLFTIILVIAQLLFVPKNRRLSLLILDEPSASFSGKTLVKFHALLSYVQKLIPSILIVTPKSEERYEGATEYTIYRGPEGAEIRKGHPSEIRN